MQCKFRNFIRSPLAAAFFAYALTVALVFVPTYRFGALFFTDVYCAYFFGLGAMRIAMTCLVWLLFYGTIRRLMPCRGRSRALLWAIPAFAVAVNNFPLVALIRGTAYVIAPTDAIVLFVFSNLGVALFEETVFRGVIFPGLQSSLGKGKGGRFAAVAISAAAFSLLHLVNLVAGADLGATLLQLGYTFLLGAMFAILMERGAGLAVCIAAHALFNCGGDLIGYLGVGVFQDIWCVEELILTAAVAAAVLLCFVVALLRARPRADCLAPGVGFRFAPVPYPPLSGSSVAAASAGRDADKR